MSRAKRRERSNSPYYSTQRDDNTNLIEFKHYTKKKQEVHIIPRNLGQENYVELLKNPKKHIVFAIGPAGTGKTMLGVQMAIKQLKEEVINKIIVTRPAVSVDEEHGFLPGTLTQKMSPWMMPVLDVFSEYYHQREIASMLETGILEMAPLAMMRGRTFKHAFIIGDEMQNSSPSQLKMLLTRIGEKSKMVITGDLQQADRPTGNGLIEFFNLYKEFNDRKLIDVVNFDYNDIERHPAVKEILAIYKES